MRIGTVVNFCTNESGFIGACLEQVLHFSEQVVVPVASHFFDGTPEDVSLLQTIYEAFPECLFVEYPFIPDQIPPRVFQKVRPASLWHCLSRLIGVEHLKEEIETVLFLDADEIADGPRVSSWLKGGDYQRYSVLKLANYWYFREAIYRADTLEDSILLAKRQHLSADLLLHNDERDAIYQGIKGLKGRGVLGKEGRPLFHHFSWVRTEAEMLKKVKSWGHRADRDWEALVRKEFSGPFQGKDFIHGYQFDTVTTPFEIPQKAFEFIARGRANVVRLEEEDVKRYAKRKSRSLWHQFIYRT